MNNQWHIKASLNLPNSGKKIKKEHKKTNRFELLSLNESPVLQAGVNDAGGTGRLHFGGVHEDGVDAVEVGVDHDGRPTAQVDVFLPPIRDVVRREPGLQD